MDGEMEEGSREPLFYTGDGPLCPEALLSLLWALSISRNTGVVRRKIQREEGDCPAL